MKKRCNMSFQGGGADGRPTLRGKEKGLKKLGMTLSEVLIAVSNNRVPSNPSNPNV